MLKITFIYADFPAITNSNKFNIGIALLSAILKKNNFETSLIHLYEEDDKAEFLRKLSVHAPDVLAFSYGSNVFKHIIKYIEWSEVIDIPKIHGGLHPTIAPLECLDLPAVKIVCLGEGEHALVEFCEAIRDKKSFQNIQNLWIKDNNRIIKNPVRPLIENLDELPFLDYEIFDYRRLADFNIYKRLVLMASRGCPYNCSYCCNHLLKKMYPNSSKYVRFKNPEVVINEIKKGLEKYPEIKNISFFDDTLTLDRNFFDEFYKLYRSEIGLSYSCNDRVNQVNSDISHKLVESGCTNVSLGIESGNPAIRNNIMKRNISDDQIITAFKNLKKVGIKTAAYNIFGVPEETCSTVIDTININSMAAPDKYYNAYFNAFNGTDLYDYCKQSNIIVTETGSSLFDRPTLALPTIAERKLIFFYNYFSILVFVYKVVNLIPSSLANFIRKMILITLSSNYFPHNFLNNMCFFKFSSIEKYLRKYSLLLKVITFIRSKL